jgi:hypothetical protein
VTLKAVGTDPTRFAEFKFEIADPFEMIARPDTVSPVRVPTEVMLGCDATVTDRAVATVPTILLEFKFEIPAPFPKKACDTTVVEFSVVRLSDVKVTFPVMAPAT